MMYFHNLIAGALIVAGMCSVATAEVQGRNWSQFRGPNGSGVAVGKNSLPHPIGPNKNVEWKVPLLPGHSSPVFTADRIYVTAVEKNEAKVKLWTIALDRRSGKEIWRREAVHKGLEQVHRIGSHAQSSPAVSGEHVVVFFGSCGLFCYRQNGDLAWHKEMGPFKNDFGAAISPIIEDNRVILCQDHDVGSFLASYDLATGREQWKADRTEFSRNYCTPIIWSNNGKKQIVIAATLRVVGYDLESGKEAWTVRGISRVVCMTPVIGENGWLYAAGWSAGGEPGARIVIPPFDETVKMFDKNKNGTLEETELEKGDVKQRFTQFDRDKNGSIDRDEFEAFRGLFAQSRNAIVAIRPGPSGDATKSHLAWDYERFIPFCASPLYYDGVVYLIKDGGILTCLNSQTGKLAKTMRMTATRAYYASPVAGDGRVYLFNERGELTILKAGSSPSILATVDFGEDVYATPALIDGKIYIRTAGHLYCFSNQKAVAAK